MKARPIFQLHEQVGHESRLHRKRQKSGPLLLGGRLFHWH